MNTFFDESGLLNIDDIVLEQPSFMTIMSDNMVTTAELEEQSKRVVDILKELEQELSEKQIDKVRNLLAEISVMVTIRSIYDAQTNTGKNCLHITK